MSTLKITAADRDTTGNIRVPRKLADLLPPVEGEQPKASARPPLPRHQVLLYGGVAALLLGALLALLVGSQQAQPQAATPQPTFVPTTIPTSAPVPTAVQVGLRQATVVYDAPDGRVLGAVEAGRVFTPTARYGASWVQIEAVGSGLVWLEASDPALGSRDMTALRDLTPPTPVPTSVPVVYQVQPVYSAPVEVQATVAPVPTVEPTAEPAPRCGASGWCRRPNVDTKRPAPEGEEVRNVKSR